MSVYPIQMIGLDECYEGHNVSLTSILIVEKHSSIFNLFID